MTPRPTNTSPLNPLPKVRLLKNVNDPWIEGEKTAKMLKVNAVVLVDISMVPIFQEPRPIVPAAPASSNTAVS